MTTETLEPAGTTTDTGTQDATTAAAQALPTEQPGVTSETADAGATPDSTAQAAVEYEPFAVPEGLSADAEMLDEFRAVAKELKLSQSDAQKFADLGAKMQLKQADQYRRQQSEWIEAVKVDSEFGGEALAVNLGVAKKAMAAFATPELTKVLNETGFGNHPEIIRAFYRIGKAISEDNRVITGSSAGKPADPAKRMFPNQA